VVELAVESLREELVESGLLVETSTPGLPFRSAAFERIVRGVADVVTAAGAGTAEPCLFGPPLLARAELERTGYHRSFPDLMGLVATFEGSEHEHRELLAEVERGEGWSTGVGESGLALCSAGCHALYPTLSPRIPAGGRRLEVEGTCFRHEPSADPARMQSFRQHEFVYVGSPAGAAAFRDEWVERGLAVLDGLGLTVSPVAAADPFFGRTGRLLEAAQREAGLKVELVARVDGDVAIASANYHEDHFGAAFGLVQDDGRPAHTACIGFGLERIALALIRRHGLPHEWPQPLREELAL
jgi:seryl-tRNA synthetase